ncbi:MAG: thermonuclease family protein [Acidobacteria bacterium]|nr:thermonuclease family protein [Acidobacteriota bacterium]
MVSWWARRAVPGCAVAVLVLAGCAPLGAEPAGPAAPAVEVLAVLDGDTLRVNSGGKSQTVRLIGIDAPELHHEESEPQFLAEEARDALRERIGRGPVRLVPDRGAGKDKYGRRLAYVETESGADLGAELVAAGLARVLTKFDFAREERYVDLETQARAAGRGLWREQGRAELAWLLERGREPLRVYAMTGGRYAVVVAGWARVGVSGNALDDALWAARRVQGAFAHDPGAARRILQDEGFEPLTASRDPKEDPGAPAPAPAPRPPSRRGS